MAVDVPRSGRRTPCWRMCGVGETRELDSKSEGYLPQVEWERDCLGGGNSDIFRIFTPKSGKMKPFWRAYFSDGLKPPTSCCVCNIFVYIDRIWYNQVWNCKVSFKSSLRQSLESLFLVKRAKPVNYSSRSQATDQVYFMIFDLLVDNKLDICCKYV